MRRVSRTFLAQRASIGALISEEEASRSRKATGQQSGMQYEQALSDAVYGPKQFFRLRDALKARGIDKTTWPRT
jgi:hypothetical protein